MKKEIVSWEIAHEKVDLKGYDILDYFEGDPDILIIGNETILFTEIDGIVVYMSEGNDTEIVNTLTKFYNNECEIVRQGEANILYRGGKGYGYKCYKTK